ncbi:MAG: phosphotransferase [Phycisphaerales bacterium]|nr:phosphotransferase [Phycisphaerales bacterium]
MNEPAAQSSPAVPAAQQSAPQHEPVARESFAREEIMQVLEHYPIGKVQSIREMIAGSSEAPKAVIECERGKLLLKRRARGLEHASLVGFAHEVILGCLNQGVCVPPLIGTVRDNNSMCQIGDRTYELFVFIEGTMFDQSTQHAEQAGMLLGELHRAMDSVTTSFEATVESSVLNPERASAHALSDETQRAVKRILEYGLDSHRANARPSAIVHGDWHPGNMIFDGPEVVAICDFDNCRLGSRDRELAQAMVYLSMQRPTSGATTDAPDAQNDKPSMDHLFAVWDGYHACTPKRANARLIAGLLPAVLLDEALASTPSERGSSLIQVAVGKAMWFDEHMSEIINALESR